MKIALLTLGILCCGSLPLAAQSARVTVAGKPLRVASFYRVEPDCSSAARPVVRLLEAPQSGKATTRPGQDFPTFREPSSYVRCNSRKVNVTQLWYVSAVSGARDSIAVEVIYDQGVTRTHRFAIEVR